MFDAIVVGARCSGAPTAMLLARKGYKVLAVDRATFPSDVPYTTHLLHVRGAAYLKRWGLLDRLEATGCPPMRRLLLDFGPVTFEGSPPAVDGVETTYAPRRFILDKLLVDAAREAGAEVREGFVVEEILKEGDRVVGIRGTDASGNTVEERARLVIGADGTNSRVAEAVQARKYKERPPKVMTYFAYWSGVSLDEGFDLELHPRTGLCVYAWPTHEGKVLIGANWLASEFDRIKQDPERHYLECLKACAPNLAARLDGGKRETDYVGGFTQNFFRDSAGPGWALVGDAGSNYEFCSGQGITNGFRAVELLVDAIDEGFQERVPLERALQDYQRRRDAAELPYYDFTYKQMTLGAPPPGGMRIFGAIASNPVWTSQFLGVISESISPKAFFSPGNMLRIIARAMFGDSGKQKSREAA